MLTKMKIALALCGSLLVGGVGLAAAQGISGSGGGSHKAEILEKYDTNKDGKLDDGERAQLKADMQAKFAAKKAAMLAKYDLNKDGKLDKTERAVMRNDRAEEAFKKADKNNDGQLSMDEFKQLRQHNGMRHGRGGFGRHHRRGLGGAKNGGGSNEGGQP